MDRTGADFDRTVDDDPRPPGQQAAGHVNADRFEAELRAWSTWSSNEGDHLARGDARRQVLVEIPADAEQAAELRRSCSRPPSRWTTRPREVLGGEEPSTTTPDRLHPQGHDDSARLRAGAVRLGVQEQGRAAMLDAVVTTCRRRPTCRRRQGRKDGPTSRSRAVERRCAALSALAFKIMTDPFVGSLTFARVYSGVLDRRPVLNSGTARAHRAACC